MEDNEIIDLFLLRSEDALSHTAEKYGSQIRSIAYGILNDWESAKECENDTYLEAWKRIPPHEPREYFPAFLGKITRSIAMNRYKEGHRKKRFAATCELTREMLECIPAQENTEETFEADELRSMIEQYLYSCSQEQQNVFVRRYWYCDSIRDICKQYRLSQSKVKSMLFRMRKELKQYLEEGGYHI